MIISGDTEMLLFLMVPLSTLLLCKVILPLFPSKPVKILAGILIGLFCLTLYTVLGYHFGFFYISADIIFVAVILLVVLLIKFIQFFIKSGRKVLIAVIVSVLLIINGVLLAYHSGQRYNTENIPRLTSNEIITGFDLDAPRAREAYKNKYVLITGTVESTASPKDCRPLRDASCVYFTSDEIPGIKIACYFNDIVIHQLEINQEITVKCKYSKYSKYDFGKYITFRNGVIIE